MAGGDDCAPRSRFVLRRGRARETSRARRASGCDRRPSGSQRAWSRPCRARRAARGSGRNAAREASVRCPDAVFLDGAFDAYFAASLDVDEVLRRVTLDDRVGLDRRGVRRLSTRDHGARAVEAVERFTTDVRQLGFDAAFGLARLEDWWRASRRGSRARAAWCTSSTATRRASSPLSRSKCSPSSTCRSPGGCGPAACAGLGSSRGSRNHSSHHSTGAPDSIWFGGPPDATPRGPARRSSGQARRRISAALNRPRIAPRSRTRWTPAPRVSVGACTSATCSRARSRCGCAMPTAAPNRGRRRFPSPQRCPTCWSR